MFNSLSHREMQIKTTWRFHLAPVRMDKINKTNGSSCWWECGVSTLIHWWWECKLVWSLWKSMCLFLRKLECRNQKEGCSTYITLGHIPKEPTFSYRDICPSMFLLLYIQPEIGNNLAEERIRECGTCTQQNITQMLKNNKSNHEIFR